MARKVNGKEGAEYHPATSLLPDSKNGDTASGLCDCLQHIVDIGRKQPARLQIISEAHSTQQVISLLTIAPQGAIFVCSNTNENNMSPFIGLLLCAFVFALLFLGMIWGMAKLYGLTLDDLFRF